jgi:hypothetical protein
MKQSEILKYNAFERQIEDLLTNLLTRIPFLKVKSVQRRDDHAFPDWLVEVEAGEKQWVLAVEGKQNGQPRVVRYGRSGPKQVLLWNHGCALPF